MSRPTPEAVASTDRRARDILGKTYEDAKRLARMLAERRTDEDTEAAGMMGALIFRVLNAESEVDRLRRELFAFAWEADQFNSCLQDNENLRAEIVRLRSRA